MRNRLTECINKGSGHYMGDGHLFVLALIKHLNSKVNYYNKGSLTVWALYAYFSDSQNAAFELLLWSCSINEIGGSNGKSQLAKYFQNSYALESYGG